MSWISHSLSYWWRHRFVSYRVVYINICNNYIKGWMYAWKVFKRKCKFVKLFLVQGEWERTSQDLPICVSFDGTFEKNIIFLFFIGFCSNFHWLFSFIFCFFLKPTQYQGEIPLFSRCDHCFNSKCILELSFIDQYKNGENLYI